MLKPRPQLKAYSAPGCCLCDDARPVLENLASELGFGVQWIDITSDPALEERYREQIPVGFLEGRKVFKYQVDEELLRRRVNELRCLPLDGVQGG